MSYKITWKPSPNFFEGRNNHLPIALVHHRMVGFLPGTDTWFANPDNQVSAHFGVGFRNGVVEISQYVDLSDSAWHAGNYDSSGGWPLVKKTSTGVVINPNYYTIGIEHEDSGPNDGRVHEDVLKASLWLDSVLLTGNIDLMRFVGIRVRDSFIAAALAEIQPGVETLIDHNRIAGTKKPFCWRPYKLDTKGFIPGWQPRLLDYLRSTSVAIEDVLALLETEVNKIVQEKNAAVADAQAAKDKLTVAKSKALTIGNHAAQISALADEIKTL
jgi:hypothetical protein